jgi:putative Holliday junction resolvase
MGRVLAIDYGQKRCGLAATDPLRLSVNPQEPCATADLAARLAATVAEGDVDLMLVGWPLRFDGRDSDVTAAIRTWLPKLRTQFPEMPIAIWDERFTTKMARQGLIDQGANRRQRADKAWVNSVSAAYLLRDYLDAPPHVQERAHEAAQDLTQPPPTDLPPIIHGLQ